ncbi:MAG: hypothetical protein GXP42_14140 [Chloroflexi bacterium]|nr:hypothetical protein [Chloroflexota bacterium]
MRFSRIFLFFAVFLGLIGMWGGVHQAQGRSGQQTSYSTAPRLWFEPVEWVRYGDPITIHYEKGEGGADISVIVVQRKEPDQEQWDYYTAIYPQPDQAETKMYVSGDAFQLRAQATDVNGEQSLWVESKPINKYNTFVEITYADHRGNPLPVVEPRLASEQYAYDPVWQWVDEEKQRAYAYVRSWNITAAPDIPGYGRWGAFRLFSYHPSEDNSSIPPTATIPIYMPPLDNQLGETGDADSPLWEVLGRGVLHIQQYNAHANYFHIYTPLDENPAYICPLWEFINIDAAALNQPTLSLYYSTNIPHLTVLWQGKEDGLFQEIAVLPPHPPAFTFRYEWVDMVSVRDKPGRPCFRFQSEGVQNPYFRFDSVAFGSTRSNLSLRLRSQPVAATPGMTATLTFAIANHSAYTATGRLEVEFEGLSRREQLLPIMSSGDVVTASVVIKMPTNTPLLPYKAMVGATQMDDAPEDNLVKSALIVDPNLLYLPRYNLTANRFRQSGGEQ